MSIAASRAVVPAHITGRRFMRDDGLHDPGRTSLDAFRSLVRVTAWTPWTSSQPLIDRGCGPGEYGRGDTACVGWGCEVVSEHQADHEPTRGDADARQVPAKPPLPEEATLGPGRRIAVRVFALVALLAFNFMLAFVVSDAAGRVSGVEGELARAGSVEARIGAEHPGEAVHLAGAATALAIGVSGLGALVIRPQRAGSATHAGLAAVGWLLVAAVVGDPDNHGGQAGALDLAFVILPLPALITVWIAAPWRVWRRGHRRPEFLVAAVVGLPWLWYAIDQGLMQRHTWPPLADPHHQAHWFSMALLAGMAVLLVAGSALPGRGWRLAAVTGGGASIVVAAASLVAPDSASALHPVWAAGALVWGLGVLGLTWRATSSERITRARSLVPDV
jgi:hypothetical protein